tara:strand:+ start:18064 stop:19236 length:1173 start_codon:yes stop_codon:yes gene_type:complete
MSRLGINTGSTPNDGTGDTLLAGAVKINSNFQEVYNVVGDGTNAYVGIVTQMVAGSNISITTSFGSVTVAVTGLSTANINADSIVVTGVSTLGVVTGATYFGDGSNLTGIAVTNNISSNSLVVSGVSTLGVVTGATYFGDGSNLTGVSTANIRADSIVVTGVSTLGVVTGATYFGDGSNLTGIAVTNNISSNSLVVSGVSTLGIVTGATYFGDGANLTGITTLISAGSNITVTTNAGITTIASTAAGSGSTAEVRANTLVVTGVSTLGVVTGATYYGDASYIVSGRWTLGADGTNNYEFTGIGFTVTTNDPILYLARGVVYEFENTMGAHPFEIRESENGNAYNNGVTNNAVSNGVLRFEIPFNAPNTLYYQCTSHASMGNTISVYPSLI